MKKLILLLFIIGIITACGSDSGTLENFSAEEPNLTPCVIDGDTVELYQYYPYTGYRIWIAKLKQTTTLTYRIGGKYKKSVVFVDDKNHYINGDVLLENDSIIIIKKKF